MEVSGDEEDTHLVIDEHDVEAGCMEDLPQSSAFPPVGVLGSVDAKIRKIQSSPTQSKPCPGAKISEYDPVCILGDGIGDNVNVHKGKDKKTGKLFQCPRCPKKFKRRVNFIGHVRAHKSCIPKEKYKCAQCGEGFVRKSLLSFHIYCHDNQSFECVECSRKFKYKKNLIPHQRQHELERSQMALDKDNMSPESRYMPIMCEKCGKKSSNQHEHDKHMNIHEAEASRLSPVHNSYSGEGLGSKGVTDSQELSEIDKQCGRTIKIEEDINEPKSPSNATMMSCEICDQSFYGEEEFRAHMNIHKLLLYNCDYCKKSFKHEKALKNHMILHTKRDLSLDQFLGDELAELRETSHEQSSRQQVKVSKSSSNKIKKSKRKEAFVCHKCAKIFSSKQSLLDHMPLHFQCKKCKKIFKNQRDLDMHFIFLGDRKILPCSICGNLLHGKKELERHLSDHITEEYQLSKNSSEWEEKTKKIQTIIANLKAEGEDLPLPSSSRVTEENIKIHKVTHAGKNSLRCSECRKIVRLHHDLKDHMDPGSMDGVESGEELVYISRLGSPKSDGGMSKSELYCICKTRANSILVQAPEYPPINIQFGAREKPIPRKLPMRKTKTSFMNKMSKYGEVGLQDPDFELSESMDDVDDNTLIKNIPDSINSNITTLPVVTPAASVSIPQQPPKITIKKEFAPTEIFIKEEWDIDLFGT
ncbi:hypothetical protein Pmani_028934 [Petrolisthes manimaculis]|uniref:C2H2-type domain-containing protein n=1 Tax=Petrolisthes manimaculis TaxID=1843537 RepID=A0AAE1TUD6_9EUCA|nr:hypothetical protein Pmani_028934 [Petrolisthes manimaculis]